MQRDTTGATAILWISPKPLLLPRRKSPVKSGRTMGGSTQKQSLLNQGAISSFCLHMQICSHTFCQICKRIHCLWRSPQGHGWILKHMQQAQFQKYLWPHVIHGCKSHCRLVIYTESFTEVLDFWHFCHDLSGKTTPLAVFPKLWVHKTVTEVSMET